MFVSLLLAVGCNENNKTNIFRIDNPGGTLMKIELNDKLYEIQPGSFQNIEIEAGDYTLKLIEGTAFNGKTVVIRVFPENTGGVINPLLSNYIIAKEIYVVEGKNPSWINDPKTWIVFDNHLYRGDLKMINDLIIDKNQYMWSYNLDEEFPEVVYSTDKKVTQSDKSKLFRLNDFIKYYNVYYANLFDNSDDQAIIETRGPEILNQNITIDAFPKLDLNSFDKYPEIKDAISGYVKTLKEQSETVLKSERSKLFKQSSDLIQKIVKSISDKQDNELYKHYNELVAKITDFSRRGVIITSVN